MSNLSTRMSSRKMPHKDVPLCLDLNLLEQRDNAMQALDAAARTAREQAADERMVSRPSAAIESARQAVADIEAMIAESSVILRIYGTDRTTYNSWMLACPPRKGKQETFDPSRFYLHAAKESARYVDEHGDEHEITPDEWVTIDTNLLDGEYDRLAQAVIYVNRTVGTTDVSFFGNGSETTRDSFGISASRSASGSRRAASGAGSQKKSTSKKSTRKAAE